MGLITALLGALNAIPKILDEISAIRSAIEKAGIAKENAAIAAAVQNISQASTLDEYKAAAAQINKAVNGL